VGNLFQGRVKYPNWSASLGVIEMPTDPFKQLFDLELSKAAAKERIEPAVTLLEEIRNYGHMLFARCAYRPEGGDEKIAILFLYYHCLKCWTPLAFL
jgi:hypothetical protein